MARLFLFLVLGLGAGIAAEEGDLTCEQIEAKVDGENATCGGVALCDDYCSSLLPMALRVCSNESGSNESEFRQDMEQAAAMLTSGALCGECGRAFMGMSGLDCQPTDFCNMSTQCGTLVASMETACTDNQTIPGQNVTMKDMADQMTMMCRPCIQAMNELQYVCDTENDPLAMCDNSSDCGKLISTMESECGPEDVIPGENGTEMRITDMIFPMIEGMCGNNCYGQLIKFGQDCDEESNPSVAQDMCIEGTVCNSLMSDLRFACDPTHGAPGRACMEDANSCQCQMANDPTMCDRCDEEGDCSGCEMDCMGMGVVMWLAVVESMCGSSGGNCVEVPKNHQIWQSDLWQRFKPRECGAFGGFSSPM